MRGNQPVDLQDHPDGTSGEDEVKQNQAVWEQLGWDGEHEEELGLHSPLFLRGGVAHGEDQGV